MGDGRYSSFKWLRESTCAEGRVLHSRVHVTERADADVDFDVVTWAQISLPDPGDQQTGCEMVHSAVANGISTRSHVDVTSTNKGP